MATARAVILGSLVAASGVVLACDESTMSFQGPFRFLIVASVGEGADNLVPEGGRVTISEGEQLRLRVQAVDSRERQLPDQVRTTCTSSNSAAVLKTADRLPSSGDFMEFFFTAQARGNSVLTCQNDLAGISRIVLAEVQGA